MKRVWHPYHDWEDWKNGMYETKHGLSRKRLLKKAIQFTGDHELYGSFMDKVIDSWPVSCEHNLTNTSQNRQAWIGHAAASMAIKSPESITREAWGYLTDDQRNAANAKADHFISVWVNRYEAKNT